MTEKEKMLAGKIYEPVDETSRGAPPSREAGSDAHLAGHFTVGRLLRFSLPMAATVLFTSVYSIVDGFFVSNWVGKEPFAAVNLVFPIPMVLAAFGVMVGTGGNALVAIRLGQGARRSADRLFTTFLLLDLALGVALAAFGLAFLRPAARALGAEGRLLEDCVLYGRVMLLANPLGMLQYFFQTFMVTAGRAKANTAITMAAGLTNAVLDALFIVGFGWGLAGAAWASAAGMAVGGLLPLAYFRPGRSAVRFGRPDWSLRPILRACGNGASELMASVAMPVVAMLYNAELIRLAGADGVAAWGVVMYLGFVFVAFFLGYSMSATPVVGYQWGAGNSRELRGVLLRSLAILGAAGASMVIAALALADPLARAFVGYDDGLRALTRHAFAVYAASFPLAGWNIFASGFFTGLGSGTISGLLSFVRLFLFSAAAVLLLPLAFGIEGIWWATPVEEVASLAVSLAAIVAFRRRYGYG